MPGYFVRPLWELPAIAPEEEGDPDWFPIQHFFGLQAFGMNAYRAEAAGIQLIGDHDELHSAHEELYVVLRGRARFTLAEETVEAGAGTVVAVPDPSVRRSAVSLEPDTAVLAIGAEPHGEFVSSWDARHFEGVPCVRE